MPQPLRTYGEKPIVFKFGEGEDAEEWMIGSEVGNYLRLFRGSLYKRFPGLTRKSLLPEERKKLVEMGHSQHVGASSISLLKATEVRELLEGHEEKFKGGAGGYVDSSAADKTASSAALAAALGTPGFGTPKVSGVLWPSTSGLCGLDAPVIKQAGG